MHDCIFCKIVNKEIPAEIVHEDEHIVAFKDINPKAPVHILLVPRTHIISAKELDENNKGLAGDLVLHAKYVAEKFNLPGYKLLFNVGREGGQVVPHLHLHLMGGWSRAGEGVEG